MKSKENLYLCGDDFYVFEINHSNQQGGNQKPSVGAVLYSRDVILQESNLKGIVIATLL